MTQRPKRGQRRIDLPEVRPIEAIRPIEAVDADFFDPLNKSIVRHEPLPRRREPTSGDDRAVNEDGRILILPGRDEWLIRDDGAPREPFVLDDVHNAYEWSMAFGDLHPARPLGMVGAAEEGFGDLRRNTVDLFDRPRAIFGTIMAAHETGRLKPVLAWHEEPPADTTLLRFRRDDILNVMRELGADGQVIGMMMAGRERQADDRQLAPAVTATEQRRPGPKPSQQSPKDLACNIALDILANDERRPKRGYRRLIAIARLVNDDARFKGHSYESDSVRKMIGPAVREWEAKNPDK